MSTFFLINAFGNIQKTEKTKCCYRRHVDALTSRKFIFIVYIL